MAKDKTVSNKSYSDIFEATKTALMAHGAAQMQAEHVAHATAHSEMHGNVICGLQYVESYCIQLASGRVDGTVTSEITRPKTAAVLSDAKCGFAQPAFATGLDLALEVARDTGIAMYAIKNSHTCTSLGYFTEQIAQRGMIGIGFTNASPVVAAPGGKSRVIGTNPMACSVPNGSGGMAMHFDFSTSAVALGKIMMAKYAHEPIPLGWAVDENGHPTTDPEAALRGSLCSAGGYKGWGLGVLVELMASAMTGSVNSLDVSGLKLADGPPHRLGQMYLIIDPTTFGDAFAERFERLASAVMEDDGARLPGQNRAAADSVNVPEALWDKIVGLGRA
jgi:(2R)-3-sulfolactate dehydrogenase (NADP+)